MTDINKLKQEECTLTRAMILGNRNLPDEIMEALSKNDFKSVRNYEESISTKSIVSSALDSVIDLMLVDGLTVHEAKDQVVSMY